MPHEYTDLLQNIYRDDFFNSVDYKNFQKKNKNRTVSLSKFLDGATKCPCIRTPKMRTCVDEVETNMAESIFCIRQLQRKHLDCSCSFCTNCANAKKLGIEECLFYAFCTD